jgi:hypothetical protein
VWMKFTLPTQHILYFGIQAKKRKAGCCWREPGYKCQRRRDS